MICTMSRLRSAQMTGRSGYVARIWPKAEVDISFSPATTTASAGQVESKGNAAVGEGAEPMTRTEDSCDNICVNVSAKSDSPMINNLRVFITLSIRQTWSGVYRS